MGLLTAHFSIVALTVLLVILNVHSTVIQYLKDQNKVRLGGLLGTLVVTGSLIVTISFMVISRVMDSESALNETRQVGYLRY